MRSTTEVPTPMGAGEPVSSFDVTTVRRLSNVDAWRWIAAAACDWLVIFAAATGFLLVSHWLTYVLALLVIGARQHALGVLVHEGVHRRVTASPFWNDLLSDLLAGYALLTPTAGYRQFHLRHHRVLDTPDDPERIALDRFPAEWSFPMPRRRLLFYLLRDITGLWPMPLIVLARLIWTFPTRHVHLAGVLLFHAALGAVALAAGHLLTMVILWWIPLVTLFPMCFRVRTAAEHSGIDGTTPRYTRARVDVLASTRSTGGGALGRFFFGPHNVRLHVEHHLYPSVPFYRLPALAQALRSDMRFEQRYRRSPSYLALVRELILRNGAESQG
jgi:fatty acid desaturase